MAVIERPNIIAGATGAPLENAGVPGAGTDEVQTITIGGTPTGGTFRLSFEGATTAAIAWSATNATLIANIDAALEALPTIGTGNVTTAVGTMTAGIGTATVTFVSGLGKRAVPTIVVVENAMTGTTPTLAVAETTPGVNAAALGAAPGALLVDTTNKKLYINTGTALAPTWTLVGAQT
jgi:hypothetical protein